MNILITGTTGFVGRHLYKKLAEKHDLFILVRPSTDYKEVCAEHIYIFEDDIEHLAWYLRENHIDGIIHLASLCLVTHQSSQINYENFYHRRNGVFRLSYCFRMLKGWP